MKPTDASEELSPLLKGGTPVQKWASLILLILQATAMPLLSRHSRISCFKTLYNAIFRQRKETLLVCIPSMIYVIQNNLYYVGVSNLEVAPFQVTSQIRILVTAIFAVLILKKQLSPVQWLALLILMIGVAMVQVEQQLQGPQTRKPNEPSQNPMLGFMAVVAAGTMSGFASIYFEKILKRSTASVYVQNVRLAVVGIPLRYSGITMLLKDTKSVLENGVFYGFDSLLWIIVANGAAGGVIIAAVMKYADNILKTYGQSVAIVTACVGSGVFFGFQPTIGFMAGTALVLGSIFLYDRFPPSLKTLIVASTNGETAKNRSYSRERTHKDKNSDVNLSTRT